MIKGIWQPTTEEKHYLKILHHGKLFSIILTTEKGGHQYSLISIGPNKIDLIGGLSSVAHLSTDQGKLIVL